jgi:hypothetical protein
MIRVRIRRWLPVLGAALLVVSAIYAQDKGRGRKYVPPPPTCKVTVTVVKASNGKPVESAAVVFHPMKGNKDEGNMELKTNEDGKATIDVIPIGDTVRLQVIANGFQTYGNDYELPGDTKEITVKLSRPARQYSIYENHPDQNGSGQSGSQNNDNGQQNSQKPQ